MSIELLTQNHGHEIITLFESAKRNIDVISPFLGYNTCKQLSDLVNRNEVNCRVITRFYREDFIQNASSLRGLRALLESGIAVVALKGLHTKLYHIDNEELVITSANYTYGGLYANFELGIYADKNEHALNLECAKYFNYLWSEIEKFNKSNNNRALITLQTIDDEEKIVNQSSYRTSSTTNINRVSRGAEIAQSNNTDLIEDAITQASQSGGNNHGGRGGWIKFGADAVHRHHPETSYVQALSTSIQNLTFFPTRPVGIRADDRIFMALVSYDSDNVPTPIIVGRAYAEKFISTNVMTPDDKRYELWMENYPYFIKLHQMEVLNSPAKNGISLLEAYRILRGDIYPSTYGKKISFENIRKYHYQKDKIGITSAAAKYIDIELEEKFTKFGSIEIA